MTYCALLIPNDIKNVKENKEGFIQSLSGKFMSGVDSSGINLKNASTLLKNTASLISEGVDTLGNKFSGIALAQLLADGKISNDTALDYLTQGFPRALGLTSVAMGFQSVAQLKTALKNENGVNVQQFISSFQNFGSALSDLLNIEDTRANIDGFDVVEIDVVTNDGRSYQSETPDRRVESGQTYQEFIHNMPDLLTLDCYIQDGRRYNGDEFEDILLNLRDNKIAINIILGETQKESYVLTNFNPNREAIGGYQYSLEFKKIQVGQINLVTLNIPTVKTSTPIVKNEIFIDDNKTEEEQNNGYKQALDETKNFLSERFNNLWASLTRQHKWGEE